MLTLFCTIYIYYFFYKQVYLRDFLDFVNSSKSWKIPKQFLISKKLAIFGQFIAGKKIILSEKNERDRKTIFHGHNFHLQRLKDAKTLLGKLPKISWGKGGTIKIIRKVLIFWLYRGLHGVEDLMSKACAHTLLFDPGCRFIVFSTWRILDGLVWLSNDD